ncbi:hypothetical protein ACFQ3R_00440 [Mesonia ostreae]|uniref:Lipid A biosynthesis lauroyl acyltransferase n=1 Tax=Mesonia ostreae TaxID=861110 RepID=A0ABU2KJF3_9FLAO|nr:hypothetical protein [Mesonia ostreae]MDT0294840.1 hypothetical protein [Mesonia ostreae]
MKNNEINELYNSIQNINIFESDKWLHDFNFISASIGTLLPKLSFNEHLKIAKKSAFYQILSSRDERNYDLIRQIKKIDFNLKKRILVTFHYSSYRLLNSLLISWSVPFKLVADDNYIKKQGDSTIESYNKIAKELGVKAYDFEIINAEERTVIFKCLKAINEGYSLVFYADGNSGIGGMTKNQKNIIKIPFLESSLYVRKGIAVIASLLKVPICVILLKRNILTDSVEIFCEEDIDFPENRKDENDLKACTINIFENLEKRLSEDPGQWEGWFYYHNFIEFSQNKPKGNYGSTSIFNNRFYGVGKLSGIFYILDKNTLKLIPISEEVYLELLNIIKHNKIEKDFPLLKSLKKEKIIINI